MSNAVQVFSDNPDRFADGAAVFLEDGRALTVRSARWAGARLLASSTGIADRTAAESAARTHARGSSIDAPPARRREYRLTSRSAAR
ncbi:MAG: hypothetical protein U0V56_13450 [Actinomycetota bacterium]